MSYTLKFEIPMLPKTTNANSRVHWRVKHKEAKLWDRLVWSATIDLKPKAPLKKAQLTLTRYSSVEPDYDGLVSSFKGVIDSLVTCFILENDKMSNIGIPLYEWRRVKPKQGKISVCVEEI